jgi:hypothetical protein
MWTPSERKFFRSLNTPFKIQSFLDGLDYNPVDDAASPRYVLMSKDAHCLEGGLLAAVALEFLGHRPLMISLQAEDDDHHVITVFKDKKGWGSISKSNTTLLRGRDPIYFTVRELVMSYFEFYFNMKGKKSLYAYSSPINLNHYNHWDWRFTDHNLVGLGKSFNDVTHYELIDQKQLKKLPKVSPLLMKACFLGANVEGLYRGDSK